MKIKWCFTDFGLLSYCRSHSVNGIGLRQKEQTFLANVIAIEYYFFPKWTIKFQDGFYLKPLIPAISRRHLKREQGNPLHKYWKCPSELNSCCGVIDLFHSITRKLVLTKRSSCLQECSPSVNVILTWRLVFSFNEFSTGHKNVHGF